MGEEKIDEQINQIKQEALEESDTIVADKVENLDSNEKIDEQIKDITDEGKTEENKEVLKPKGKKHDSNIIIWIFAVLAFIITVVFVLLIIPKKNSILTEAEKKKLIKEYGEKLEETIDSYFQQYDILLTYEDASNKVELDHIIECSEHRVYKDGKVYIGDCSIDREDVTYTYGELKEEEEEEEKVEFQEGKIKVYVSKSTNKATLEEPSNKDDYEIYDFDLDGGYANLGLLSEDGDYVYYHTHDGNNHLFNYKKKEEFKVSSDTVNILPILYNGKYDPDYVIFFNKKMVDGKMDSANSSSGVYNLKEKKKVFSDGYHTNYGLNQSEYSGRAYLVFDALALDDGLLPVASGLVNYRTAKTIVPTHKNRSLIVKGDYLFVDAGDYNHNDYHIYDYSGNEPLKDKCEIIYFMYSKDYILVRQDGDVKLINIDGTELYNYKEATISLNYNTMLDGDTLLFQFDIDYKSLNNDYQCTQIRYNTVTQEGSVEYATCKLKTLNNRTTIN